MKKRFLSVLLCLCLLVGALPVTVLAETTPETAEYAGVPWARQAVEFLNVIYGAGTFTGDGSELTKSEAETLLAKMRCVTDQLDHIGQARPDEAPNLPLSRADACAVLVQIFNMPIGESQEPIEYLNGQNIIMGDKDGNLNPEGTVTEAEFAVLTFRVMNAVGGGGGVDSTGLLPGSLPHIAWRFLSAIDEIGNRTFNETINQELWGSWIVALKILDQQRAAADDKEEEAPGVQAWKTEGNPGPDMPDSSTKLLEAAQWMILEYKKAGGAVFYYTDVEPNHWFHGAIVYLTNQGIINGERPLNTSLYTKFPAFDPNRGLYRKEMAALLARVDGYSDRVKDEPDFDSNRVLEYIQNHAVEEGYLAGPASTEEATAYWDGTTTREEAIVGLYKMFVKIGAVSMADVNEANLDILGRFTDVDDISESAKPYLAYAVSIGVINGGGDGKMNPGGEVNRATAAMLLYKALLGLDTTKMEDYRRDVTAALADQETEPVASVRTFALVMYNEASTEPTQKILNVDEDWRLTEDLDLKVPAGTELTIKGRNIYEMGGRLINTGEGTVVFENATLFPAESDPIGSLVTLQNTWDQGESTIVMELRQKLPSLKDVEKLLYAVYDDKGKLEWVGDTMPVGKKAKIFLLDNNYNPRQASVTMTFPAE